jgi:hypothetical protein
MKNTLKITLIILNVCGNLLGRPQSVIIIGNSSYEFKADTYRVYFNISEIHRIIIIKKNINL